MVVRLLILVTVYDGVSFTSLFIISCTCKHYRVPYNKAVHRVIKVDMLLTCEAYLPDRIISLRE